MKEHEQRFIADWTDRFESMDDDVVAITDGPTPEAEPVPQPEPVVLAAIEQAVGHIDKRTKVGKTVAEKVLAVQDTAVNERAEWQRLVASLEAKVMEQDVDLAEAQHIIEQMRVTDKQEGHKHVFRRPKIWDGYRWEEQAWTLDRLQEVITMLRIAGARNETLVVVEYSGEITCNTRHPLPLTKEQKRIKALKKRWETAKWWAIGLGAAAVVPAVGLLAWSGLREVYQFVIGLAF